MPTNVVKVALKGFLSNDIKEIRDSILEFVDKEQYTVLECLIKDIYEDIDLLLSSEELNPKERLAVFELGKKIVPQVKIIVTEFKSKLSVALRIRVKMINEQLYCTSLKELKEEAARFVSNEDIKTIIYKCELISEVERWMINQGASEEWAKVKASIYNAFVPAAKKMKSRYPTENRTERYDKGEHHFETKDLKRLDADLLLPILKEFSAVDINEVTMEITFGKHVCVRGMYNDYSVDTVIEKPKVVDYSSTAKVLLDSIEYISELKCEDYLTRNPGELKMKILIKPPRQV